jgi:3-deoxy-manno-octulosonate cytidylyltransferase (CMP-KDO synthetase)
VVKAFLDGNEEVTEFTRKLTFPEEAKASFSLPEETPVFKHIGIYGYKAAVLNEIVELPPHPLEQFHSLEQFRWLKNGYKIRAKETTFETVAVDTREDLERILSDRTG